MKKIISFIFLFSCGLFLLSQNKISASEKLVTFIPKDTENIVIQGDAHYSISSFDRFFLATDAITLTIDASVFASKSELIFLSLDGSKAECILIQKSGSNYAVMDNINGVALDDANYSAVQNELAIDINLANWVNIFNDPLQSGLSITIALKKIEMKIVDNTRPVFGETQEVVSNVSNPLTLEEIKGFITATSEYDGDLTDKIQVVSDNFTANKYKLGVWPIEFSVTNTGGNTATLTVNVHVVDVNKPIITGQVTYTTPSSAPIARSTVEANITVTDNYDTNVQALFDWTTLNEKEANFDTGVPGIYKVKIIARDASGNEATQIITITVYDDVAPQIYGASDLITTWKLKLSAGQLLEGVTASDNISNMTGKISISQDDYTVNYNKLGTYEIIISASDDAGNTVTINRKIKVVDNEFPVFSANGYIFKIGTIASVSKENLIKILTTMGKYSDIDLDSLVFIIDDYSANSNKVGLYAVKFSALTSEGNSITETVYFDVIADLVASPNDWLDIFKKASPLQIALTGGSVLCFFAFLIWLLKRLKRVKK